ncbi:TfoX/Sxy family DNA transformation protein [Pragia fontium]|uniref:Regulator of competence-specific genes n=2 Tax=Pragia fontium TaxID=82985 RepID=A0AAJ5BHV8_9GAMM|nr:TfoX/Sxy family DNA transformation protein [Pragia fontium]AKJ42557.1 hypothetical protein QQ39_11055 [Pragia fontium]SFD11713.1 regulator of competence-specific genes [Pragia fontium DSM 5563 = ATCC 49100]SUB82882.1 Regulator of competence-specific genes [Pragia fontium]VEJ55782.1 Regulator of competence-specific genes [Pragia fontium]GKX62612.1 DNA transformation protein tfoX [Pragia fontium]
MNREDTKSLVKDVIGYFSELGELTSRSMFGGYGICKNKVMFGLVSDDKFYLRANKYLESVFISYGMSQFIYNKRGVPVLMKYYHVNESLWQNEEILKRFVTYALSSAMTDMEERLIQEYLRLKDLPNLNIGIERLLRQVGVRTREDLMHLGALRTYIKLREFKRDVKLDLLFSLAGAIKGCHVAALPNSLRNELIEQLRTHDQTKYKELVNYSV